MTIPMVRFHNAETDELVDREMNAAELKQLEIDKAKRVTRLEAEAKAVIDKAAAQAKLAALGLTTDDLKALGL